jgi:3-keto-disaccharide hydrolase
MFLPFQKERTYELMRIQKALYLFPVACLVFAATTYSRSERAKNGSSSQASASVKAYLGRWDLTLKAPDHEYPSWLELSEENGQLKARYVGRWGNARPLPKAELSGGQLTFVSPKEEENFPEDMVFTGKLVGRTLEGTISGPKEGKWTWSGRRAPSLKRSGTPKWGKPIKLFDGKTLNGWHMMPANGKPVWTVKDGAMVSPGRGPELVGDRKFEDFKLHVEFNCGPQANSGVYLRGRYEVQVETNSIQEGPSHHMGAIYGFIAPQPEQPRTPDKWQTYDITLVGRTVTVVQNATTIIDHQEIPGITGGALDSHEGLPGPIYLQGSEEGHVLFRSVVLTPAME